MWAVFNHLPDPAGLVLQPLVLVGSALGIGVLAGVAMFLRRLRLGIALAVAGSLGWAATRAVGAVVSRPVPTDALVGVTLRGVASGGLAPFPSSHAAVAVALALVVRPWLDAPARRATGWGVAAVGAGVLYVGLATPVGLLVGAAVGAWAGATANLVVGAPGRRVDAALVREVLDHAGIPTTDVHHVRGRPWAAAEFAATTETGDELVVRVLRRAARRLGRLDRVRRRIASADVAHRAGLADAHQQVDHEALATLLAARGGVRVPPVWLATDLPSGAALIATEAVPARPLEAADPATLPDAVLVDTWRQVRALHGARVAHHDLSPETVLVDADRAWLSAFGRARVAAGREALRDDVAELLVTLSAWVGADRAVDSALAVLSADDVVEATRTLHPLALPRRIRTAVEAPADVVAELREYVAERTGAELEDARPAIRPTTVLGLLVAGGAVYVVLPQVGSVSEVMDALTRASWPWLAVTFLVGLLTAPAAAVSYWGSTHRSVPLGGLSAVQLASTFTGRLTPASVGGIGLNLLYLERVGLTRTEAASAATLNLAGGVVVHAILFGLAALQLGLGGLQHGVTIPTGWPVLVAVGGALVLAGAALGSPVGRRRVVRPVVDLSRTLVGTVRRPVRTAALLGGSAGVTAANALAFLAATYAVGITGPSALEILAVYVGGSAIGAAAPTPGGLGAVEAALVAALVGVGVATPPAVAAVLSFRLLTFWAPILPGMVAFRVLRHRDVV